MTLKTKTLFLLSAATLFLAAAPLPPVVGESEGIIGRPLTPMSFAGVARRTTYRAVAGGAYYGAAPYAAAPYVATPYPYGVAPVAVSPYW